MLRYLKMNQPQTDREIKPISTKTLKGLPIYGGQWIGFSLMTGLMLSIISSLIVWNHERDRLRDRYAQKTEATAIALQEAINDDLRMFQELKDFYGAVKEVDEEALQWFVQSSMSHHPSVNELGWIPYLSNLEQPKTLNNNSPADNQSGKESFPITYTASKTHPQLNVGLDLALKTPIANFQEAKDTGKTVLLTQLDSMMVSEQMPTDDRHYVWAIAPIYQTPFNYSTVQARRQNLQGFLVGIFDLAEMVQSLQTNQKADYSEILQGSHLVIVSAKDSPTTEKSKTFSIDRSRDNIFAIYKGASGEWLNPTNQSQELNIVNFLCEAPNPCIQTIQIANQKWLVQFLPTAEYLNAQANSKIWLTFLIGLSLTGMFTIVLGVFWSRDRNYRQERQLFAQMQQELNDLKQQKTDLEILLETTTQHSDAIENELQKVLTKNSEAYAELQNANVELTKINSEIMLLGKMINLLQACLTEEEANATIAKFMKRLFPNQSGAIYRICDSKNLVESVVSWGVNPPHEMVFNPHDCWSLRSGKFHLFDADNSGLRCKHYQDHFTKQSICIPLMAQGETFGLLHLSSHQGQYKLTEDQQKLALTVAEHTGLALANLKLRETLRFQSIRDPLTGLYNRRYLEEFLQKEIYRSQRSGKPFAVVMIDVDHFKRFNDTFGHEAGDLVLQELGKFLRQNVRGSDVACRYGGEELTLILPESSLENSEKFAEKIREGVKYLNVKSRHQSLDGITISIGVAVFPQDGLTYEQLLESADRALYRAKKAGRDRVMLASDTVSQPPPPLLKALS